MTRKWIAVLAVLAAACVPAPKVEIEAPRLQKLPNQETRPPRLDTPTPETRPTPQPAVDVGWPPPYTYGDPTPPPTPIPPPSPQLIFDRGVVNIVLLGSDRRPQSSSFRTDVLIVVSIQPATGAVAMLSIPRDLYVYLPGYSMQRINTAFPLGDSIGYPGGGPALLADTIRYNLGIPIDFYARAGNEFGMGWGLFEVGEMARRSDSFEEAWEYVSKGLALFAGHRDVSGVTLFLASTAGIAQGLGDMLRAARLAGAFTTLRITSGADIVSYETNEITGLDFATLESLTGDMGVAYQEGRGEGKWKRRKGEKYDHQEKKGVVRPLYQYCQNITPTNDLYGTLSVETSARTSSG